MHWKEQLRAPQLRKLYSLLQTYSLMIVSDMEHNRTLQGWNTLKNKKSILKRSHKKYEADYNRCKALMKRLEKFK